jgi:uncharacterized protein
MTAFEPFELADVELRDPLYLQRREDDRAYLLRLSTDNLLRPYRFEAGLWSEGAKPEGIHWGWESPTSQLRGHFLGHWLSAAAMCAAATGDPEIRGKAEAVVDGLALCQEANGGEWLGSIPEKYLHLIAAGRPVWAPHYTVHKTFMGLLDAHKYMGSSKALELAEKWARWFSKWTSSFSNEKMDELMDNETGGMLEIWAELFAITGRAEYRTLMERYARRTLFDALLAGSDPLTNMHANTTIPEALGAARAYEATGEERWLEIAKAYWELAAERLPRFATGGSTSGEVWTPVGRARNRLGDKDQELCTVYNMMRLAEFLLRHTGEARYADYRERSLRNGILAQGFWRGRNLVHGLKLDHPITGLVSYFLPLRAGASKLWASETEHFFCCHGSNVQANAAHTEGIYYKSGDGLAICQLVDSALTWDRGGDSIRVEVRSADLAGHMTRIDGVAPANPAPPDRLAFVIRITCPRPVEFELAVRLPWWLAGEARIAVNGEAARAGAGPSSFARVRRAWRDDLVSIELPKALVSERLAGSDRTFAFLDGPDLLAGLCAEERTIYCDDPSAPAAELEPDDEREWSRWNGGFRTRSQDPGIRFIPLREVGYERYTVYFDAAPRRARGD